MRLQVCLVVPQREVTGGSGQQMPDVRERLSTGGAQEAVVPDFDEALWQAMLEEAADACLCGKRAVLPWLLARSLKRQVTCPSSSFSMRLLVRAMRRMEGAREAMTWLPVPAG